MVKQIGLPVMYRDERFVIRGVGPAARFGLMGDIAYRISNKDCPAGFWVSSLDLVVVK